MEPSLVRRQTVACRVLVVLAIVVVLIDGLARPLPIAAQDDGSAPLDLAAMALRTTDFEAEGLDGFGDTFATGESDERWSLVSSGYMALPEAGEHSAVAGTPEYRIGQLYQDLTESGWQRR